MSSSLEEEHARMKKALQEAWKDMKYIDDHHCGCLLYLKPIIAKGLGIEEPELHD